MSAKQHDNNSCKKSGQKSRHNVSKDTFSKDTDQQDPLSLPSPPLLDSSPSRKYVVATDNSIASSSSSTSMSISLASLHHRKPMNHEEFEKLDQCGDQIKGKDKVMEDPSKMKYAKDDDEQENRQVPCANSVNSGWIITTSERNEPGLWSWLTSSRVVSDEQQQFEENKERVNWAKHQRKLKKLLGDSLQHDDCDDDGDDGGGASSGDEQRSSFFLADKEIYKNKSNVALSAASKRLASSSNTMTSRDWVALSSLTVMTLGYEYVFDTHPPLGKLILAGISSFSNYNGSVDFGDIGDQYPISVPYLSMRVTLTLMGALCAPMAYITLKSGSQGASAAILAAVFIAYDNALITNYRLMALDAPLMFFTAATTMFWTLFTKHSNRPFTGLWWTWLLLTGISMAGAISTKLIGILSAAVVILFAVRDLWARIERLCL
ncbi:hypothetical protein BGX26_008529 [Mortierella sp. AD094]|nr:hypothetical protein BGX26_008529 [Mortierella sp. AD094]